jgi:outer membrane protein OmpA-like peptidoglycan-associated protein/uncharacterized protein YidB (DUF937 family)
MGTLDGILTEAGSQFGLSTAKTSSLLSSLLSFINDTPGGLGAFIDRFRKAGLGDTVSSWFGRGSPYPLPAASVESAVGHDWIDKIASKSGLAYSTAASALGFLIPNLVQRLAPGGVVPSHLPSDVLAYAGSATSAVAAGARQAAYSAEGAVKRAGSSLWLWLIPLLAILLIVLWWGSRSAVHNRTSNLQEELHGASQRATAALTALPSGFNARSLVDALNLNVINFGPASAQIPPDSTEYLTRAAAAIKAAPPGTVLVIGGHTDSTGDSGSNQALSQQRADAVRNYLIQQGVPAEMLVAKGYGDSQPVASNDTEEGKFRNRRIEFSAQ